VNDGSEQMSLQLKGIALAENGRHLVRTGFEGGRQVAGHLAGVAYHVVEGAEGRSPWARRPHRLPHQRRSVHVARDARVKLERRRDTVAS